MSSATFTFRDVTRRSESHGDETLELKTGINVLVGEGNTGKTKWFTMLDYLMGEYADSPAKAFGEDLAEKYDAISATCMVNGKEVLLERFWKKPGLRNKVLVNEEAIPAKEFSAYILQALDMPILRRPKGNPFASGTWPELSWRVLLRHIYRQQRFWSDIADKQPESEQFACLAFFTGIAEKIFSEDYGEYVRLQKEKLKLEAVKEEYIRIVGEITKDLVSERSIQVAPTLESIEIGIGELEEEVERLRLRRQNALESLQREVVRGEAEEDAFRQLGQLNIDLRSGLETVEAKASRNRERSAELASYASLVQNEISKLERAKVSGNILASLQITHCPACDQAVSGSNKGTQNCFLCYQSLDSQQAGKNSSERIDLEIGQLEEERDELDDLIRSLNAEFEALQVEKRQISTRIRETESQLRPFQQTAAALIPPEVGIVDMEAGRLQERRTQLENLKVTLNRQANLSSEIDKLEAQIEKLDIKIKSQRLDLNLNKINDILSDASNSYLNQLVSLDEKLWKQQSVRFKLKKGDFDIFVGDDLWRTKLGGTLTLYFLISYHYALLSLTRKQGFHYPGLTILDLPPTLEGQATISDKENFILEPFLHLVSQEGMEATQVIAAGASFEGLQGVNRIEFTKVWK